MTQAGGSTPYSAYPTYDAQYAPPVSQYQGWSAPQMGGHGQYGTAQSQYPDYPPRGQEWGGPPAHGYQGGGYAPPPQQGGQRWDDRGESGRGGGRDKGGGPPRDRFKGMDRDQGWGSRKRN